MKRLILEILKAITEEKSRAAGDILIYVSPQKTVLKFEIITISGSVFRCNINRASIGKFLEGKQKKMDVTAVQILHDLGNRNLNLVTVLMSLFDFVIEDCAVESMRISSRDILIRSYSSLLIDMLIRRGYPYISNSEKVIAVIPNDEELRRLELIGKLRKVYIPREYRAAGELAV